MIINLTYLYSIPVFAAHTLEEELDAISELHNAKTVHDRCSAEKEAITWLHNYITTIGPLMLYGHHAAEIQKKLEELHLSRALFRRSMKSSLKTSLTLTLLKNRSKQQSSGLPLTTFKITSRRNIIANQYKKGSYLEEQLENYDLPEKGDASIILADFKRLQDAFDTYLSKTARFKGDRGIAEQREKVKRILNARRKKSLLSPPTRKKHQLLQCHNLEDTAANLFW